MIAPPGAATVILPYKTVSVVVSVSSMFGVSDTDTNPLSEVSAPTGITEMLSKIHWEGSCPARKIKEGMYCRWQ